MEKEYKVGEKIKLGNVTLEVVGLDDYECGNCFFKRLCDNRLFEEVDDMVGNCVSEANVKFVQVKEE